MRYVPLAVLFIPLACATRIADPRSALPAVSSPSKPTPSPVRIPSPVHQVLKWSIRAFPQAALSIALPENGVELNARDLDQVQALLAVGVRVNGHDGPTYALLVYPISNPLLGASLEQRLYLLPHLLSDLGPEASRRPVDLDGLHGVEFVTRKDTGFQRARVFATARHVIALTVKSAQSNQATDLDAQLFFDSLQWYDD